MTQKDADQKKRFVFNQISVLICVLLRHLWLLLFSSPRRTASSTATYKATAYLSVRMTAAGVLRNLYFATNSFGVSVSWPFAVCTTYTSSHVASSATR